jgi:membrane protease YdiL (CAAX protease family)
LNLSFLDNIRNNSLKRQPYIYVLWLYLIAITFAELIIIFLEPWVGLTCYGVILVVFIIQPSFIEDTNISNLILGLILVPLIRIMSLVIPLIQLPEILWYPLIYIPLLSAAIIAMRTIEIKPRQIGITKSELPTQIAFGLFLGFMIGLLEYAILQTKPMVVNFTIGEIIAPAAILLVTTGLVEELIFRGILQYLAISAMGSIMGIIYVSLIFAVLHAGFHSITDVAFVFLISLVFAIMVQTTRSIIGVIIAHGTANIVLFLVAPFILTPGFQLP